MSNMKQINSLILICILSMLNLSESIAQGLSLSFNLTETDLLANMIADSKKYKISSLTLSGYVNQENVKYIKDLNLNGTLVNLDLSDASHICTNYSLQDNKTFNGERSDMFGTKWRTALKYLYEKGWEDILSHEFTEWNGWEYNNDWPYYTYVTDSYEDDYIIRKMRIRFYAYKSGGWNEWVSFEKEIIIMYTNESPKLCFQNCSYSNFVIPSNIQSIGGSDCRFRVKSCNEFVLGNRINTIGENAFKDSHIETIILNSTIKEIKNNAFENATGNCLANSQLIASVEYIGDNAFKNSSLLENTNGSVKLQAKKIGNNAFLNAVIPKNLSLPNIQELGDSTFFATDIVNVDVNNIIKKIGNSTFENCSTLQTFNGGENIETIGDRSFYGCKQLNAFTPSNNLRAIGQEAFGNNTALVSFSIPGTTKSIGYKAFANSGLRDLDIGIYEYFHRDIIDGCDSLEIISASNNNTKLKSANGVLLSKDESKILAYPCAKEDALFEISNQVTEIADSAFYSVNKLRALTVSETITNIGKNAFGNSSIIELKVLPSTTPKVTDNISGLDQSLVRLFVHEKDFSTYYIANYWGDFKNIFVLENAVSPNGLINVEVAGTLPENIGFGNQFKYNILRLSGYLNSDDIRYLREMAGRDVRGNQTIRVLKDLDFSQASIVKGGSCYYIKNEYSSGRLTTSDNIVGESMFEGCNFTNLAISESTTKIGDKALYGCQLESFKLPTATKEINPNSFFGMATLKEFIVDSDNPNYMSLNGVLFTKDGKSLLLYPYAKQGESYSTPESTINIGEQALGGSHLKTVILNEGLKEIETMAFNNLGSLEGISLPSTLETIGHRAFWGCNNLLDITCKAYYPPTLKYDSYSYFGQPYNNFSDKTYENAVLFVPKKNGGYSSRSGWKLFNNVIESDDWMSGIQAISDSDNAEIIKSYDLNGRVVTSSYHGVSILKMSDGKTKKVFVK